MLLLALGCLRVHEGFHADIFRRGQWFRQFHQRGQREAAPRHDHGPGLDAAVPVDPLLERHLVQQVVDIDGLRLGHVTVEGHGPGPDLQGLGGAVDILVAAELVEIVVAGGVIRIGDRPVWPAVGIGRVPLHRVEMGGGIWRHGGELFRRIRFGARLVAASGQCGR